MHTQIKKDLGFKVFLFCFVFKDRYPCEDLAVLELRFG